MDSDLKGILLIALAFFLFFAFMGVIALGGKEYKLHCYREAAAMGIEESRHVHELCD